MGETIIYTSFEQILILVYDLTKGRRRRRIGGLLWIKSGTVLASLVQSSSISGGGGGEGGRGERGGGFGNVR